MSLTHVKLLSIKTYTSREFTFHTVRILPRPSAPGEGMSPVLQQRQKLHGQAVCITEFQRRLSLKLELISNYFWSDSEETISS